VRPPPGSRRCRATRPLDVAVQRGALDAPQQRAHCNCCKLNPINSRSPKAVLRSSHFIATVLVADVGVAECSKALALKVPV
jgi:hypothetical protein